MEIYCLTIPGSKIDHVSLGVTPRIQSLLDHVVSVFYDANTSLILFKQAYLAPHSTSDTASKMSDEEVFLENVNIQKEIYAEWGLQFPEKFSEVMREQNKRIKIKNWARGSIPRQIEHRICILHARSFLYSFDSFDRLMEALIFDLDDGQLKTSIIDLHHEFNISFPDLREVRNTSHHMEDRVRGLVKAGKKPVALNIQPIDNEYIKVGSGALIFDALMDTKFSCTMKDGFLGSIDVSSASMNILSDITQRLFDLFTWCGDPQDLPH